MPNGPLTRCVASVIVTTAKILNMSTSFDDFKIGRDN